MLSPGSAAVLPALSVALLAGLGWRLAPSPLAPEPWTGTPVWLDEVAEVCDAASSAARLAESAARSALDLAAAAPPPPPPPAACEPCVCPELPEGPGLTVLAAHLASLLLLPAWLWLVDRCCECAGRRPDARRHEGPARAPGGAAPVARGGGVVR